MDANALAEIALIERLLSKGVIKMGAQNEALVNRFINARWIRPTNRRSEYGVYGAAVADLSERRKVLWPTRDSDLALLHAKSLSATDPRHLAYLPTLRAGAPSLPSRLNRRNFTAIFGSGPKSQRAIESAPQLVLTRDGCTRVRVNQGLIMHINGLELDLDRQMLTLGEVCLPERALLNAPQFSGAFPEAVITIENLGSYIDMPLPGNFMAIFSPGNDLELALQFLPLLFAQAATPIKWVHFGDWDPEGFVIADRLANALGRQPAVYIPSFLNEYIGRAQKSEVIWSALPEHPAFLELNKVRRGIFQEKIMLDERLAEDLGRFITQIPAAN